MDSASPSPTAGIIAPPPVLYLSCMVLAFALDRLFPLAPWSDSLAVRGAVAACFLLPGMGGAAWAFHTLRRWATSPNPYRSTLRLATDGPFRWTRNPIYLAMTLMYLAVALACGNWWAVSLLPVLLGLMQWGVILREERYLAARFGDDYRAYQATTRRWL